MQKIVYHLLNKFLMNKVETELLNYLKDKEKEKTIFDVGCYRGSFTENIIKHESEKGIKSNIFLFDPNPKVKIYIASLLKNSNVKYFDLAFDNSNEKKKFTLNQFFEPSGSSLVSAHKEDKLYNFTRKSFMQIVQPFRKVKGYIQIDVQTQTIDNFCLKNNINFIDLLKLDTEGNEFNILKGAAKFLSENKIKIIYTEISATKDKHKSKVIEIENFLKKYNFEHAKSFDMRVLSFLSGLKGSDHLFIHKNI